MFLGCQLTIRSIRSAAYPRRSELSESYERHDGARSLPGCQCHASHALLFVGPFKELTAPVTASNAQCSTVSYEGNALPVLSSPRARSEVCAALGTDTDNETRSMVQSSTLLIDPSRSSQCFACIQMVNNSLRQWSGKSQPSVSQPSCTYTSVSLRYSISLGCREGR